MAHVKVPHSFFIKSRRDYSDWRWALIREFVQNSYDAGATRIEFYVQEVDSTTMLSVTDNGCGMTLDVMENALLCMGGSQKQDQSVGGFGVAKQLLYFANLSYSIHSGNTVIKGAGGTYQTEISGINVRGTRSLISIGACDFTAKLMGVYITRYAANCYFERPVEITLNGKPLEQDSIEYDDEVDTELGTLWFRDNGSGRNQIIVTLHGLPMFIYHSSNSSNNGVDASLCLTGDYTQFTSNRDSLVQDKWAALNDLVHQLITERSALRLGGSDLTITLNPSNTDSGAKATSGLPDASEVVMFRKQQDDALNDQYKILDKILNQVDTSGYPEDFVIRLSNVTSRRSSGAAHNNGTVSAREVVAYLKTQKAAKLAHWWVEWVQSILGLPSMTRNQKVNFGFLIGTPGVDGCCARSGADTFTIYMNPHNLGDDWMDEDAIDLAIHEVAHIKYPEHTEEFCSFTDLLRKEWRRS